MAKQTKQPKTTRRHHSSEYRAEALGLADRVGVADAAKQLGLHDSQIYSWRAQA
ncbi:MAG: transposase, partial [Porticoccaceae bacterium]